MPIYAKTKGTWRVVVWSGNRPHERIVRGTKSEARAVEASLRIELHARGTQRADPTFTDYVLREYAPHCQKTVKASTWYVRRRFLAHLAEEFGEEPIRSLTTERIERWKLSLIERGNRPRTVNTKLTILLCVIRFAERHGRTTAKPHPSRARVTERRVRVWTRDEVQRVFATTLRMFPRLLPMVQFGVNTGLRRGELIAADWTWVDLDARVLHIPSSEEWSPKSRKPRDVPLSDAAIAALLATPGRTGPLFPHRTGRQRRSFPANEWYEMIHEANLLGGPHTMRHTFASHFLLAPHASLWKLSQVLGHSVTLTTTLYAHLLPGALDDVRNAVNLGTMVPAMGEKKKGA